MNVVDPLTGETPIFSAIRARSQLCVGALLDARCNVNHHSATGETPLLLHVRVSDNQAVASMLIAAGALISGQDNQVKNKINK